MTSRVEAVRAAIKDVLIEPRSDQLNGMTDELAEAAIEASDAWLKEQADGVAEKLNEIEVKSIGLTVGKGTWTYMREMKSEKWHIAMIKAKNAINAVTSLGSTSEAPDQ